MVKVTRVGGRGTKRRTEELKDPNWANRPFKEYQRKRMKEFGGRRITGGRGTRSTRASDVKDTELKDLKGYYVSTGRGTGKRRLK